MKYYELIGENTGEVIGACPEDCLVFECDAACSGYIVGEITKEQFDDFYASEGDFQPKSTKRFYVDIVKSVKLTPI